MAHWTENSSNGLALGVGAFFAAGIVAATPAPVDRVLPSRTGPLGRALGEMKAENARLRRELEATRAYSRRLEKHLQTLARK